jgi:hypothetical protein
MTLKAVIDRLTYIGMKVYDFYESIVFTLCDQDANKKRVFHHNMTDRHRV